MERPPSVLERAIELASLDSPVNFALTARLEGGLTEARLRSALERAAPAHPLMASRLAGRDEKTRLVFDGTTNSPIRVFKSASDTDWVEAARRELLTPFRRASEAPVRFALLQGPGWTDLVVCCDHAVSDGLSAAYLIAEILRLTADPGLRPEPATTMPPALPDLAPEPVQQALRLKLALARWITKAALPILRRISRRRPPPPPLDPTDFHLLAWSLEEAATTRLVESARRRETTVHAALCAAFLTAFAERETEKTRRVSCPVSLRERPAAPVGRAFGLYVGIAEAAVDCSPGRPFWEVARQVKANLTRAASDTRLWLPILAAEAALGGARDADLQMVSRMSPKVRYDLSITNLGRLDFPSPPGGPRLRSLHGPAVHAVIDERVLGVSTASGRICFALTFREKTMNRADAETLRGRAMEILADASASP